MLNCNLGLLCILLAICAAVDRSSAQSAEYSNMHGGDILLTPEQQATFESMSNPNDPFAPQSAVVVNQRSLWIDGVVPYIFDSSLSSAARSAIQDAIATYAEQTCIRFVPRSNQQDYVRFFRGTGCFSYIGRIGGPQDISIGQGCEFEGTVLHEMFHALGRWHEQSRPDRDMYVRIQTANIQSGTEGNFDITSTAFATTQGVPYDIRSIMHYSARAFSRNGQPTIVPVDNSVSLNDLGQRQGLTNLDLQHVATLYCAGSPSGSWSSWGSWSSCSRSCNGGTRTRTRSCVGGTSCEGSNVQTQQCNTNACPVPSSWGSWGSWSACTTTCGGGRQRRIRQCVGGNDCVGTSNQFRDCNTQACPEPATWGSWGSWSACSSTCQGGIRQRRRTCQNGNTCPGRDFEDQNCNTNIPCVAEPDPDSGEWSSWSSCSLQCGGGVRFRVRNCGSDQSCDTEQESCNTQDCTPEPTLRGIRHHGCWYLNSRARRLGTIEGRTPELMDDPFTRENPVSKCGVSVERFNYNFFGITVGYCITGSNLLSDYQYVGSQLCRDGRGGYNPNGGFYVMDVYEITSQQVFLDSVVATTSSEEVERSTAASNMTMADDGSGASARAVSSLFALLCASLLALFTITS